MSTTSRAALVALTLVTGLAAVAPAEAQGYRYRPYRGISGGGVAAGVVGGLALGAAAAAATAAAAPAYAYGYGPCYYGRRTVTDVYGNVYVRPTRVCEP